MSEAGIAGLDAETVIALVHGAMNEEDDALALAAIETLNTIDPENLVGAPQVVRLLRRSSRDEAVVLRLVRALAINGRYYDDAKSELEHLVRHPSRRVQAMVREALAAFDPPEETEAKSGP